ncbi:unnamed protein product [Angiostrongylus costaricensis]|uniref:Metalloendopeptidase n=1 Tax=Angiostrongylus costaricensis TaxID=334426 RepID=A0A0R3P9I6_ANGCS|nr:unnamed protein product [Angiostrongylus costaricensis]
MATVRLPQCRKACAGKEGYEINTIKQAMMRIEANTCIRFRPRSSEWDYIFIVNRDGEGCMETHIVQHELLHVIGLWHEHMRYDRDQYITVFRQNIAPGYASQFKKISSSESTVYGLPYDYTSIMHYAKTAFAIPGTITMKTRDPRYMNVIGRQRDASRSDYLKVCQIYGCNQCNGEGTRPEGGESNHYWIFFSTQAFLPQKTNELLPICLNNLVECIDKFSQLCVVVKQHGLLDCNGNSKGYCCATCKAITQ